jgi:hypothetical protein
MKIEQMTFSPRKPFRGYIANGVVLPIGLTCRFAE